MCKLCGVIITVMVVLSATAASTNDKPLANRDVVALAKAELGDEVILAKIEQSPLVAFDVSADALILLKKDGVSSRVITAMINRTARADTSRSEKAKNPGPFVASADPPILSECRVDRAELPDLPPGVPTSNCVFLGKPNQSCTCPLFDGRGGIIRQMRGLSVPPSDEFWADNSPKFPGFGRAKAGTSAPKLQASSDASVAAVCKQSTVDVHLNWCSMDHGFNEGASCGLNVLGGTDVAGLPAMAVQAVLGNVWDRTNMMGVTKAAYRAGFQNEAIDASICCQIHNRDAYDCLKSNREAVSRWLNSH
jgi:hypothetical protein